MLPLSTLRVGINKSKKIFQVGTVKKKEEEEEEKKEKRKKNTKKKEEEEGEKLTDYQIFSQLPLQ